MKRLNELTMEDCQEFLDEIFEGENVKYSRIIFDPACEEGCGIEYEYESKQKNIISFSNPELITCFYKHDVDLTIPLEHLRIDFADMDETNSVLFEYAMSINRTLNELPKSQELLVTMRELLEEGISEEDSNQIAAAKLNEIRKVQKEFINKL